MPCHLPQCNVAQSGVLFCAVLVQVTAILACAELYFSSMNRLLDQRRLLQQQLKNADEGLSECQKRLLGVDGGLNQLQVAVACVYVCVVWHAVQVFVCGTDILLVQ